jgi:type I restriction enzyme S subunit
MRINNVYFGSISNQPSLRFDVNYRYFFDIKNALTWPQKESYEIADILSPIKSDIIGKGLLESEEYLVELSNIDRRFNHLTNIQSITEIGSDKRVLEEGDVIIPRLQPRMGNIFTNLEHKRYLGSSELVEYRCDENKVSSKFLYYILTHPLFLDSLLLTESGKTHRRVSPDDLLKYKIPNICQSAQISFINSIKPIEREISITRKKIKSIIETINLVFSQKLDLDFSIADNLQKELIYHTCLDEVANEELKFDISLKYRNIFRENVLYPSCFSWIPLGKMVCVKGGKRLPKGQDVVSYDTGYHYIRVDDLDTLGRFDIENIKYITKENHDVIKNYIAHKNDILLTIVGATVGKCGILPECLDGENISENFAVLNVIDPTKFKSLYLLYVLMSKIGQYQINEYKGRGSQGKLAIFRIKKIQIPDLKPEEQEEIIKEIDINVKDQGKYLEKMVALRNQIDNLLNDVLEKNS